ncbi:MAG: hypothetical protein ACRCU1_14265, partial [Alsobacter sp.]
SKAILAAPVAISPKRAAIRAIVKPSKILPAARTPVSSICSPVAALEPGDIAATCAYVMALPDCVHVLEILMQPAG